MSVSEPHRSRTMRFTCVHRILRDLKAMMEAAGFGQVDVRNLSAGIVAIHRGYKF